MKDYYFLFVLIVNLRLFYQDEEDGIFAALERKVRNRNCCFLPTGGQRFDFNAAHNRDTTIPVSENPIFNHGPNMVSEPGPQISSPEESGDEELDKTVTENEAAKPDDVLEAAKQGGDENVACRTVCKRKPGEKKKTRRSQLELLGICSNQLVAGLGLRSGKGRVDLDTHVVEENVSEKDEEEDDGQEDDHDL